MKHLSTDPYKGTRDFYPDDMAVQRYIFDVWTKTAESFGYEQYHASILEPSALYKAKGAANEEIVSKETYTFIDRGDREVTLRPEMTPTVARMVAGKRQELTFPLRWYSIPNLFRYERPQKGRLREHWQLNCDIFGTTDYTADVELISLAYQILLNFGAEPEMFEIRLNDRREMTAFYNKLGITDTDTITTITRLNDRFHKITTEEYKTELAAIVANEQQEEEIYTLVSGAASGDTNEVAEGLKALGITNVRIDRSLARGFDYYTGTIFEFFDVSGENNRAMMGGGRYDNLTTLFGGDPIPGVGFGFGDVVVRDFLETHNLLTADITAPTLMIIPTDAAYNLEAQKIAQQFRANDIATAVDMGTKKLGKKIAAAGDALVEYALIVGENEIQSNTYTLKNLMDGTEITGSIEELRGQL